MNVAPTTTYEAVMNWGATGATIGMRVIDNAGATTVARVTGFVEYPAGSGIYYLGGNIAPATSGQYTLVYDDDGGTAAAGHVATEDLFVTSSAFVPGSGDTYGTVSELFRRLKIRQPTTDQESQGEQVLLMATGEINSEIDLGDDVELDEPWQEALATEVCYERAVELWAETPFGIIALETGEFGPTHTARNTWERYAHKLQPLKNQWGIA